MSKKNDLSTVKFVCQSAVILISYTEYAGPVHPMQIVLSKELPFHPATSEGWWTISSNWWRWHRDRRYPSSSTVRTCGRPGHARAAAQSSSTPSPLLELTRTTGTDRQPGRLSSSRSS